MSVDPRDVGICRSCGKRDYPTRKAAKAAGKQVGRELGKQSERGPVDAYRCPTGRGTYHWGHGSQRRDRTVAENRTAQAAVMRAIARCHPRRDDGEAS